MRAAVVIALLASACWTAPRAPGAEAQIPGVVWVTPPRPWHVPFTPTALGVDGTTALLVGYRHLARFDLQTGEVVQSVTIPPLIVGSLVRLAPGRWLLVGSRDDRTVGVAVDVATLAVTPIALPSTKEKGYLRGSAAVLPDGGVALSGEGMPLAIYDPATWTVRKVLDQGHGWSELVTDGVALFGKREFATFRVELATGAVTPLGRTTIHAAAAGTRVEATQLVIGDRPPIPRVRQAEVSLLDPRGTRLVEVKRGRVELTALPALTATRIELGPVRHGITAKLALAGDRLVVAVDDMVRVVDLATHEVTPALAPPYGGIDHLEVADDGGLRIYGAELWQARDGQVTRLGPLPDEPTLIGPPGVQGSFVTAATGDREAVKLYRAGAARPTEVRALPQGYLTGWFGAHGAVAVEVLTEGEQPGRLLLSTTGGSFEPVTPLAEDATIDDVDVDAGIGLVAMKGSIWPFELAAPAISDVALRIPACGEYGVATLERGGNRVVTFDEAQVALWDRTTGANLAAIRIPREVYDAVFIPHRDELVLVLSQGLAVWSPKQRVVRMLTAADVSHLAVSRDGHRLALQLPASRFALVDVDALIAGVAPVPAQPARIPAHCGGTDPFAVVLEGEGEPYDEGVNDGLDEGGD